MPVGSIASNRAFCCGFDEIFCDSAFGGAGSVAVPPAPVSVPVPVVEPVSVPEDVPVLDVVDVDAVVTDAFLPLAVLADFPGAVAFFPPPALFCADPVGLVEPVALAGLLSLGELEAPFGACTLALGGLAVIFGPAACAVEPPANATVASSVSVRKVLIWGILLQEC
jgi:hypothetical protein